MHVSLHTQRAHLLESQVPLPFQNRIFSWIKETYGLSLLWVKAGGNSETRRSSLGIPCMCLSEPARLPRPLSGEAALRADYSCGRQQHDWIRWAVCTPAHFSNQLLALNDPDVSQDVFPHRQAQVPTCVLRRRGQRDMQPAGQQSAGGTWGQAAGTQILAFRNKMQKL